MTYNPAHCRILILTAFAFLIAQPVRAGEPIDTGTRRELFVDDHLIEQLDSVQLKLHRPQPREVVITHDQPWEGNTCFYHSVRRHTLRVDGFVSASADLKGGRLRTKPLVFDGTQLEINFSTSAAGSLRVELQDAAGKPINGFSLADCPEIFGDSFDRRVTWKDGADLASLVGKPTRLLVELRDADLYSFQFTTED